MDHFDIPNEFLVGTELERKIADDRFPNTYHWSTPEALNEGEVGGKNGKLAAMMQAGLPIPPGYAIPAKVFTAAVDADSLISAIEANDLTRAKEIVLNTPVPEDVLEAYDEHLKKAGKEFIQDSKKNCLVSVRSSALAEDSGDASFAGQLKSFLYQSRNGGERADDIGIEKSVQGVWASAFTETAMFYKMTQVKKGNLPESALTDIGVAVVVQAMLDPDAAGVMMTANTSTGNLHEHKIQAVPGVGENYVNGTHSADEFITDKSGKVLSLRGEHMLLQPSHIKDLTEHAHAAEQAFGGPQDMEWAVKGPNTYILQSRPITAGLNEE